MAKTQDELKEMVAHKALGAGHQDRRRGQQLQRYHRVVA